MAQLDFRRLLTAATLAAISALSACGPGQGSSSTTVVLTGPSDKVDALITRHKLLGSPAQAQMEKLDDGRERASFRLPKGLPMGEVIALGKDAAKDGVSYEFSSGTKWGSDAANGGPGGDPEKAPSRSTGGPTV